MNDQLTIDYEEVLRKASATLGRRYRSRLLSDLEGSCAEAVLYFGIQRVAGPVSIHEDPNSGGIDFKVHTPVGDFLLEVTNLKSDAVAAASGLPNSPNNPPQSFSQIGRKLYAKTISKVKQIEGSTLPMVLAITTEHIFGSVLINERAAQQLITGKEAMTFPIDEPNTPITLTTVFQDSAFFGYDSDTSVGTFRSDISAILLVHIAANAFRPIGVLNPKPTRPLDIRMLPSVPFLGIAGEFNDKSTSISLEWKSRAKPTYVNLRSQVAEV